MSVAATISSVRQKSRVLNALLLRELMQRYGHGNFGFLWLIGEPIILTVGVMVLWWLIHGSVKNGVHIVPFVLTGYSMLTLWRHLVNRSLYSFSGSADLLFHRFVKPIDVLIARQFLEIFGCLFAFFALYVPLVLLDVIDPIDDYLLVIEGWFLLAFFGFGVGLILASLTEMTEVVERFVQPIMYVMIPFSGTFYMVAWLPKSAQEVILWSPMVSASEMFRAGVFGPSIPTHYDATYLFYAGLLVNSIGFALAGRASKIMSL